MRNVPSNKKATRKHGNYLCKSLFSIFRFDPESLLTLEFSAADKEGKTRLCAGYSQQTPEETMRAITSLFKSQGWDSATPAPESVTCVFFTKGGRIALASASTRESGGSSALVMVKE